MRRRRKIINDDDVKLIKRYSNIIKVSKDGKNLRNDKMLLLEGRHLIKEAILSRCVSINKIFYTNYFLKNQENHDFFNTHIMQLLPKIKVNQNVMDSWSHLKTNQGIIGNKNLK